MWLILHRCTHAQGKMIHIRLSGDSKINVITIKLKHHTSPAKAACVCLWRGHYCTRTDSDLCTAITAATVFSTIYNGSIRVCQPVNPSAATVLLAIKPFVSPECVQSWYANWVGLVVRLWNMSINHWGYLCTADLQCISAGGGGYINAPFLSIASAAALQNNY